MGWGRGGGWGWGWALLAALLVPAPALLCPRCGGGACRDEPCPSPHAACRRVTLRTQRGGRELLREEGGGCDVIGPPDVAVTFLSHGEEVTLREERRGGEGRPSPTPLPPPPPPPEGRPLLCLTCDAADGSCQRPLLALRCPRPADACVDFRVAGLPGGVGEGRLRGCGGAGGCRGLLALDTGRGRQVALRCCTGDRCEPEEEPPPSGLSCWGCDGPEPHGCDPQVVACGGGLTHCALAQTHGPSGEPWLLRGCASPAWCEAPVGLGGLRGGALPHCCQGALCNGLPGDPAPGPAPGPAPRPAPLRPLLLLLLLLAPHV